MGLIMKIKTLASLFIISTFSTYASAVEVKFFNSSWDGVKVPEGQQCQKFGGIKPSTPTLLVTEIPVGSDSIVLEYSDRDSERMNNGGHGIMSYAISAETKTTLIPSVLGHTFDLPKKFTMIEAHRSPTWDTAGAYMPPCSGSKNHAYYVTLKTMQGEEVTGQTVLEMGNF
jgi:hypothetical protein